MEYETFQQLEKHTKTPNVPYSFKELIEEAKRYQNELNKIIALQKKMIENQRIIKNNE